jgi:hypothetical protein
MRKDMAQLLVETPRRNSGELYRVHRRKANRDPDDAPTRQGMRRPYVERKQFGEYFAPLLGYLRKSCGRPWDKVFSDLNASLSGGGTVIDHVKMHVLQDFVTLQPVWHKGEPCYPFDRYHSRYDEPLPIRRDRNGGFYVDRHGALRQARAHCRKPRKRDKSERVQIDAGTAYHKIDGAWFRVWTKELGEASPDSVAVYDIVLKKWIRALGTSNFLRRDVVWSWGIDGAGRYQGIRALLSLHGSPRFAYRKEQISNRTIRREKLNERSR